MGALLVMAAAALAAVACSTGTGSAEHLGENKSALVISSLTVRLTRLYIGRYPDDGLYRAGVTFDGVPQIKRSIWDCPRTPELGFGEFLPPPDGQTGDNTCDAPSTIREGADIAVLAPFKDRTVFSIEPPSNATNIPVWVRFVHPTELALSFDWRFDVDPTTGAITFAEHQGMGLQAETHGADHCVRSPDDWMLCWQVDVGQLGPGQLSFPWDVVDGATTPAIDGNGLPLDPRWNWQTVSAPPRSFSEECPLTGCTSQSTERNDPSQGIGGVVPLTCDANLVGANASGGHLNWDVVTYRGKLEWEGHSVISSCTVPHAIATLDPPAFDDDYNIHIDTVDTPPGAAPSDSSNSGATADNSELKLEFKASETVDNFSSEFWAKFRAEADSCSTNPRQIKGMDAIAIGLLGLDQEHESKSELHPTFGLAIHQQADPSNDVWQIFGRNFGDEGYCSSAIETLSGPGGAGTPLDLTFTLPRPATADPTTTPTVAAIGTATSSLSVTLTRLYVGTHPDDGIYRGGVQMLGRGSATSSLWECPRNSMGGLGDFVGRPEGQSGDDTCDAPGTLGLGQDIAQLAPWRDRTQYSVPIQPGVTSIPVVISFTHPTESGLSFTWHVDVSTSTGAETFQSPQGNVVAAKHDTDSCARGPDDWMICWQIRVLPLAPVVEAFVGPNRDATITLHLPAPSSGHASQSTEVRLNWAGDRPPPPFAQPPTILGSFGIPLGVRLAIGDIEQQFMDRAGLMSAAELEVLTALIPPRQPPLINSAPLSLMVHTGLPTVPAKPVVQLLADPGPQQSRDAVLRAFCGALNGQSPTGQGSCAAYPPATLLKSTGSPAASGWYTTPVTVTLSAVDAGGNGIDHTEYTLNDVAWTTYASPFVLPEGETTLSYRSVDHAATEPTQERHFKVDTRAPASSASATASATAAALSYVVTDASPGSGPAGLFSIARIGTTPTTTFSAGANASVQLATRCTAIEYWGVDVAGNAESPHHHTADSVPPVLTLPPNVTTSTCTASTQVNVGQASATDECVTPAAPTARVIGSNGQSLADPLPVIGGVVTLGPGTHTVEWTATDGTNVVTRTQNVIVGTRIQTRESFLVDDGSAVTFGTGFAAVFSSGQGPTRIGNQARSGSVLSVGPVSVLHGATVNGDVTTAGSFFKEQDGTVTGSVRSFQPLVLPALPTLPAFPSPVAGSFTVSSGTLTKSPGSYTTAIVNGGTLVLGAGDYFFQSLTINSNVTVRVSPATRIFVRDSLIFRSPLLATTGTAIQSIALGFAGSSAALEARFNGTFTAPNAAVTLGSGTGMIFSGSFFARVLEVRPATTLACQ